MKGRVGEWHGGQLVMALFAIGVAAVVGAGALFLWGSSLHTSPPTPHAVIRGADTLEDGFVGFVAKRMHDNGEPADSVADAIQPAQSPSGRYSDADLWDILVIAKVPEANATAIVKARQRRDAATLARTTTAGRFQQGLYGIAIAVPVAAVVLMFLLTWRWLDARRTSEARPTSATPLRRPYAPHE